MYYSDKTPQEFYKWWKQRQHNCNICEDWRIAERAGHQSRAQYCMSGCRCGYYICKYNRYFRDYLEEHHATDFDDSGRLIY